MIRLLAIALAVGLLLIAAGLATYHHSRQIDPEVHQVTAAALSELQEEEASLNREVALLRTGERLDFDHLVATTQAISGLQDHIYERFVKPSITRGNDFDDLFEQYEIAVHQHNRLLEYFKSDIAALRSSHSYSLRLLRRLSAQTTGLQDGLPLQESLAELSRVAALGPWATDASHSERFFERLENLGYWRADWPTTAQGNLERLMRHAGIMEAAFQNLDQTDQAMAELDTASTAAALDAVYRDLYDEQQERFESYLFASILLALVTAILVGALFFKRIRLSSL